MAFIPDRQRWRKARYQIERSSTNAVNFRSRRNGNKPVTIWSLAFREQGDGPKALLFEHCYTTGSGKTTVEYLHTVMARPAGHRDFSDGALPTAPWLFMGKYPGSRRRSRRKQELTSPELVDVAQTWSITGDATTAARFLKPHVRRTLETSPAFEAWCIGAGWVCCSFEGTLDAENMERFLAHSREVLAAR